MLLTKLSVNFIIQMTITFFYTVFSNGILIIKKNHTFLIIVLYYRLDTKKTNAHVYKISWDLFSNCHLIFFSNLGVLFGTIVWSGNARLLTPLFNFPHKTFSRNLRRDKGCLKGAQISRETCFNSSTVRTKRKSPALSVSMDA